MKISIITATYNSSAHIEDCLRSVAEQTYADVEHIIIDGASGDSTLEIVRKFPHVSLIISEKDSGIYDAMNKGIGLAKGDIVGILNSDDLFADPTVLKRVVDACAEASVDACYGDLLYVDREDVHKAVRFWRAGDFVPAKLRRGWIPPHPTFFVKKELYVKWGRFNTKFNIAADYELILRFLTQGVRAKYIPYTLVHMREGGHSAKNILQRWKGWKELYEAWRVNHLRPPVFLFLTRPLFKIHQYFFVKKQKH